MENNISIDQEIADFERETEAFSLGFKQDFVNFLRLLQKKEIPLAEAVDKIVLTVGRNAKAIIETQAFANDWRLIALKCDKCGEPMRLEPVNTNPANQVGGKYKAQWYCPDVLNCGHYLLSRKSIPEIVAKRRRKANYKSEEPKNGQ